MQYWSLPRWRKVGTLQNGCRSCKFFLTLSFKTARRDLGEQPIDEEAMLQSCSCVVYCSWAGDEQELGCTTRARQVGSLCVWWGIASTESTFTMRDRGTVEEKITSNMLKRDEDGEEAWVIRFMRVSRGCLLDSLLCLSLRVFWNTRTCFCCLLVCFCCSPICPFARSNQARPFLGGAERAGGPRVQNC
jgi:hypothetical protein